MVAMIEKLEDPNVNRNLMMDLLTLIGVAMAVFAATNVDDLFLLAAFFADPSLRTRSVVEGQFLGIGVLVAISAAAALVALTVPEGYPALLGIVPLALGLRSLVALRRKDSDDGEQPDSAEVARRGARSQVATVAGVTIANGGDNLGVYIPLFAREPGHILIHASVFAVMTTLWCFVGFRLIQNRVVGACARRYGRLALSVVLIGLGLWILSDARVLLG